jgi:integrase
MTLEQVTTWGQAVDYTFKTRQTWRSGSGAVTARINTGHFTRLRGRSLPLKAITQPFLQEVCVELEDEGKSDATINRIISAVSTVLNHLAFDGVIPSAPKFRRRREAEHRQTWYTKDEVSLMARLAAEWGRQDLHDAILTSAYTGLRMSELLNLRAMDVDLTGGLIHVGGRPGFVTKAMNYRAIPIHDQIRQILNGRMENSSATTRIFGDDWSKDELLRAFKKVRDYIGKSDAYVYHSLRHSFATWAVEADVNIRTIQELLGHKRIETTLKYAKVSNTTKQHAIHSL